MAISSTLTGEAKQQADMQAEIRARSHAGAADATERRWAAREAAEQQRIEERSAERRRLWNITAAEWKIVCRLTHWFKHVNELRLSGDMHAAVAAHGRFAARVAQLAPCNADGTPGRLYRFAADESEHRKLIDRDYLNWSHDVTLGYFDQYKPAAEQAPDASAPAEQAPSEGERVDASGPSGGERCDLDAVDRTVSR